VKDLQRDGAVVPQVLREIDDGHAPASELAPDAVVVCECLLETTERFGQDSPGSEDYALTLQSWT
jgi:hypothetical protein